MDIKALTKKILKTSALGRIIYPLIQGTYRSVAIPMRRRRLQKHGLKTLEHVHSVLSRNNIKYFIDFGTLLGFVRENGFIKHDDDIDLSIYPGQSIRPCELLKCFLDNGFTYVHAFSVREKIYEFTVRDTNQLTVDVFFPRITDEPGVMAGPDIFWDSEREYPSETANTILEPRYHIPSGVKLRDFNGVKVSIPESPDKLLVDEYGDNWQTPISNYVAKEVIPSPELDCFAFRLTEEEALSLR